MINIRKLTEDDIVKRLHDNNPTIKYIEGFTNTRQKALFKCIICDNLFESQAHGIYNGLQGCPKCYRHKGVSNMINRLKSNNPLIEYVHGYIEPHKQATFKCKKCGHIWDCTAYEVYIGRSKCPNCSKSTTFLSDKDIKEKLKINNPKIQYIGGYTGSLNKAKFYCTQCKHEWETTAFAVYLGKTGCPKCAYSKGEQRISQYLEEKKIKFKSQWIFEDCKNIYPLPFDFFLPDKNICLEYDGEHHFIPVIRSKNMNMVQSKENLKKIKMRDKIKTKYCNSNNIELIRIPYTEFNNIEKILDSYFKYGKAI